MPLDKNRRDAIRLMGAGIASASGILTLACAKAANEDVDGQPQAGLQVDYVLQSGLANLSVPEVITLLGAGGFGSWAGLFAGMAGVRHIEVWDPGIIDAKDTARDPYSPSQIGRPKVEGFRELLLRLRPSIEVDVHQDFFRLDRDSSSLRAVVFNGASDHDLHMRLPSLAAQRGLKYVAGVYSGTEIGVTDSHLPSITIEEEAETAVWVGSSAMSAVLAVHSAFVQPVRFAGSIEDISLSIEELDRRFAVLAEPQP